MSIPRAVLFDFFGTLTLSVRRGPAHTAVARALGCDPNALVEALDRSYYNRARGEYGTAEETLRWLAGQVGARPSPSALRSACAARVAALRADTTLRSDAVATLRALRHRGLRTAVVSDCTHELPQLLPTMPVASLLDACAYSVQIGECKPHRAIYLEACARLGVPPSECLYVGDGGSRELTGAAELGMTAVRLTAPDLTQHLVFNAEPDWAGPSVAALSELIRAVDRSPIPVG
ncbi:HAD family hydrolase [Phytohabitans sp. ZYX-F-186]|uniref:HAD family hydrolase n=1 Tax=Phytohabitans maris TaxID=3071409 RepID=A0ABU0ZIB6_9ACTN|nr:HAD family hydrolase [Phytohabitans sp. ZYX-F-186]MDQ7906778.1 HAD family hydrolase [Phytohabitans sp. ZYX-F-186]